MKNLNFPLKFENFRIFREEESVFANLLLKQVISIHSLIQMKYDTPSKVMSHVRSFPNDVINEIYDFINENRITCLSNYHLGCVSYKKSSRKSTLTDILSHILFILLIKQVQTITHCFIAYSFSLDAKQIK